MLFSIQAIYDELQAAVQVFGDLRLNELTPINQKMPPQDNAALRFYGNVSWAYVATYENGTITFRFLSEHAQVSGMDPQFEIDEFLVTILALRTLLQHDLNPEKKKDAAKLTIAGRWMAGACSVPEIIDEYFWPRTDKDWEAISSKFCADAESFFRTCLRIVKNIKNDESRLVIIEEWAVRISKNLPGHVFDDMIANSIEQLGLPALDCTRVRKINLQKWNDRLRLLSGTANIYSEARRLVDDTLLRDWQEYCPVSGADIMEYFSLGPGPKVADYLRRAKAIWIRSPCGREKVLAILQQEQVG